MNSKKLGIGLILIPVMALVLTCGFGFMLHTANGSGENAFVSLEQIEVMKSLGIWDNVAATIGFCVFCFVMFVVVSLMLCLLCVALGGMIDRKDILLEEMAKQLNIDETKELN